MTVRALLFSVCLLSMATIATALGQPPAAPTMIDQPPAAPTIVPSPGASTTIGQAPSVSTTIVQPPTVATAQPPRASTTIGQAPGAAATIAQPPPAPTPRAPGAPAPAAVPLLTPQPPAPREARREGQPLNIRVDVTITDQRGGTAAAKKTVSVVTADGMGGFIRSQASYFNIGEGPLNVDTEPLLLPDGKMRVRVNLQYELPAPSGPAGGDVAPQAGSLRKTSIHENLSLILENGKAIVAAQSADPVGDRQVTIEVKATVLR